MESRFLKLSIVANMVTIICFFIAVHQIYQKNTENLDLQLKTSQAVNQRTQIEIKLSQALKELEGTNVKIGKYEIHLNENNSKIEKQKKLIEELSGGQADIIINLKEQINNERENGENLQNQLNKANFQIGKLGQDLIKAKKGREDIQKTVDNTDYNTGRTVENVANLKNRIDYLINDYNIEADKSAYLIELNKELKKEVKKARVADDDFRISINAILNQLNQFKDTIKQLLSADQSNKIALESIKTNMENNNDDFVLAAMNQKLREISQRIQGEQILGVPQDLRIEE